MKATILLVLLVAACPRPVLAGLLPVVVEELDAAATACGISKPNLERVALRTLAASPYRPGTDAGGRLTIRLTANQIRRGSCATRISVRMRATSKTLPTEGTPDPSQRLRVPVVVLCNESGDYSAPKAGFPLEVESSVEYSIRRCLGSLKY